MLDKAKFPWRVGTYQRTKYPMIVDARGMTVAQLTSGDYEDAEKICEAANQWAERNNKGEI